MMIDIGSVGNESSEVGDASLAREARAFLPDFVRAGRAAAPD